MKSGTWIAIAVVAVLIIGVWMWPSSTSGSMGTLKLQITDVPTALKLEKVLVTISEVQVHMADKESTNETNATNSTEEDGWITVTSSPQTYDLMKLVNVTELLGSTDLSPGKYTQIRLSVDSSKVTIAGTEYDLTIPSGKLKLIHPFTIDAGNTTTLTLDFDANSSVIKTFGSSYKMNPTIKILDE